jgi:DNA polymerase-3 subunit gamma/tau
LTILHEKYRPGKFVDVFGQGHLISQLEEAVKKRSSHAFLFSGPAGCGKTTLARICARELGCRDLDIRETDGATDSGVDEMRALQNAMRYKPLGGGKARACIIDEAHRISKQAFDSLLKVMEEPPEHLFWFLCTTAPEKLQKTIRSRCMPFTVKSLSDDDMKEFLGGITRAEKLKTSDEVLSVCAIEAAGSLRQGLVNLAMCSSCKTRREAKALLQRLDESDPMRELCQFIIRGGSWSKFIALMEKLEDQSPEGIRIMIVNYLGGCLKNANSDKEAMGFLGLLQHFESPYNDSEKMSPLFLSVGRALFSE